MELIMTDHPRKPFHDAVNNVQPEESKVSPFTSPYPARDKDNTDYSPKPPSGAIAGSSRQGPKGTIGYRGSDGDKTMANPEFSITMGDPDKDLWIHGKITSMEGYSFRMKMQTLPIETALNRGKITHLAINKDANLVAFYSNGWAMRPETFKDQQALDKIQSHFDPPNREFKPIVSPSQDKDHGRDR